MREIRNAITLTWLFISILVGNIFILIEFYKVSPTISGIYVLLVVLVALTY